MFQVKEHVLKTGMVAFPIKMIVTILPSFAGGQGRPWIVHLNAGEHPITWDGVSAVSAHLHRRGSIFGIDKSLVKGTSLQSLLFMQQETPTNVTTICGTSYCLPRNRTININCSSPMQLLLLIKKHVAHDLLLKLCLHRLCQWLPLRVKNSDQPDLHAQLSQPGTSSRLPTSSDKPSCPPTC